MVVRAKMSKWKTSLQFIFHLYILDCRRNSVLLVSGDTQYCSRYYRRFILQYNDCILPFFGLDHGIFLYHQRHHWRSHCYLYHCHLPLCGPFHIFLPCCYARRNGSRGCSLIHSKSKYCRKNLTSGKSSEPPKVILSCFDYMYMFRSFNKVNIESVVQRAAKLQSIKLGEWFGHGGSQTKT